MTNSTSSSFLPCPNPNPRSLPRYLDLYGKHRKQAELLTLNREIGFLEEELRSVEALQPASRCCKEVDEFVGTNPDPLISLNRKVHRSCIWKWLRAKSRFYLSWICCSSACAFHLERPHCASAPSKNWWCCCQPRCHCHRCFEKSCCSPCCVLPTLSCPDCSCTCVCSLPKCTKVCHCPKCTRNCCLPCYLCS
ncbi:guanine nucleotide-binding protein subunit gamma 3-like [Tasmannia lanceolata]|uniref:guanine nucleotide-binding protein subunit gamma 3-like n=1 Tax=Tasmannia lanceolata TaxID=3420 RepID=UPI004062F26B